MVKSGYVSASHGSTYFVCNLDQVFAIDHSSIQIKAFDGVVFGAPAILRWDQISLVNRSGDNK
jgi:hypothetical protein